MHIKVDFYDTQEERYKRLKSVTLWALVTVVLVFSIVFINSCIPQPANAQTPPATGWASFYTVKSCLKESGQFIMANGEELRNENYTCAIWSKKFGTILKVTNIKTGASVQVKVTDRGPTKSLVKKGRIVDLSRAAFLKLSPLKNGLIEVRIEVIQ